MKLFTDPAMKRFYYNLSSDVGPGKPNAADDVEFVRLGLRNMRSALERRGRWNDAGLAEFRGLQETLSTTGGFDDTLGRAIRSLQEGMGGRVADGVCSAMPPGRVRLADGKMMMCAGLQTELRNSNAAIWPRMDRITGCGPALAATVREMFGLNLN